MRLRRSPASAGCCWSWAWHKSARRKCGLGARTSPSSWPSCSIRKCPGQPCCSTPSAEPRPGVIARLLLDLQREVVQPHRLARIVFELDVVLLLVERDLRRVGHLALALALAVEPHLEERERIVRGPRL